ncbi:hypothetical protein ACH3VR_08030 [Microbacterium sp. B2969]|uniref:Nitrate ABC transporter substrate-binding protein n=1 Tax=Microbacterium alkaliflavum TaxID=3248839 RepID=A0ABW7Q7S6_9MICO
MTRLLPRYVAIATIAATALLASACSSPAPEPTTAPTKTAEVKPSVAPEATPTATADAGADPTCETIISSTTVADFESLGWTSLSDPFSVGGVDLDGGVQCIWGDFSTASDHVQIFGWAPITDAEAKKAQDALEGEGWRVEESADGVYVTESADTVQTPDDQGYGLTYLFGEGWVKYADTKQGIILIEWPQS